MNVCTAVGAIDSKKNYTITFKSEAHKIFYLKYLPECRYQDVYHKALIEFCTKYNKTIIAAFCDSAILLDDTDIITFGKALLIEREKVSILKNEVNECTELTT